MSNTLCRSSITGSVSIAQGSVQSSHVFGCLQASVRDFFTRPGASAPHVHSLHIEAVLGPGLDRADPPLPTKSWRRPPVRVQIWQRPPSLDWLTPVLRSVRSLRLTFAPEFKRDAYGQVSERAPLQARTISALLSRSDALEMLHIDLGRIMLSTLDITEWRNVLPMNDLHALPVCALPASVKQLTLESAGLLRLPYRPMTVPEIRSLERLVLRASEVFVASLDAFQRHSPQHLTLQAGSKITVPFEAAGAVVGAARQLVAKGCQIEFCGPSPDCIEVSMRNATEVPSRQQVDELVEQLRSWFVETVQTDAD